MTTVVYKQRWQFAEGYSNGVQQYCEVRSAIVGLLNVLNDSAVTVMSAIVG